MEALAPMPHLRHLRIAGCTVSGLSLRALAQAERGRGVHTLLHLDIGGVWFILAADLREVGTGLTALEVSLLGRLRKD
jgi:hypothetical protein